jgi:hypothetical protein
LTYNWTLGGSPLQCAEGSTRDKSLTIILHQSNLHSAKNLPTQTMFGST